METSERPDCGVCAAVDVHYLRTGAARAAAVLAADAAFTHVLTERYPVGPPGTAPPAGRILPARAAAAAVPDDLSGLGPLLVDGYADLDPAGRPGLGAHAHAELGIPVTGVAKSTFPHRDPRGAGRARILGTPAVRHRLPGCPALRRRTWSGACPAGTGCPTHCAAPIPSRGQARPQPP